MGAARAQWKACKYGGGASDWGKMSARWQAQCRPTKTTNRGKPLVNCSNRFTENLRAPMSIRDTNLTHCENVFVICIMKCIQKNRFFFSWYSFLCTVNIQSIDRGIYIQFGTRDLDQQKDFITFKKECRLAKSPHKSMSFELLNPWRTKMNKQTKKEKSQGKIKITL